MKFQSKGGAPLFNEEAFLSEEHLLWLPETYFPVVMQGSRFPRYHNKRSIDQYVKIYMDENDIKEDPDWGLPFPNQEAAYKSLSKYAKDILPMEPSQIKSMNLAWEWTYNHFYPYMGESKVRSVADVVPKLDKTTSSGYPFNAHFPKKKELFDECPEILDWLEGDWEELLNDDYTFCFTNSLKEEIRPTVKTQQNKIRTFTAGAVDGTVHGNRLFADMNEKMNAGYLKTASGVGMSPLKGNWDRLYRKLNVFRNGYALDESEYDSSLRPYLMWGCARLRFNMLCAGDRTPENLQRIRVYYRNLVNSLVLTPEGVFILKLTGNPSGSVNTINDNTLILYALLAYAWIQQCPDDPIYLEFEANTAKILVGDDNTWTVSDWAHQFFNAKSVIATWNEIGVTTTTDSLEPRVAQELDFLSAKTIFYMGRAVPVYDRTKLMTSLLYSETDQQSPSFALLRAAALLQVGWSDSQFRLFCREFIAWLLNTYDEICCEDLDWIRAKSNILSDHHLSELFLGDEILNQQSLQSSEEYCDRYGCFSISCGHFRGYYLETQEKLVSQINTMNQGITPKKNRTRRGKGAKATRQKQAGKGPVTPQQSKAALAHALGVVLPGKRRPRNRTNRSGGIKSGPPFGGSQLAGKGGVRNQTTNRKSMVIEEDEYIGEVTGAATAANFGTTQYPINIGQSATFPWGAGVVKNNFEKYCFDYLEFYYKREVSEFATNGTTGKVMLSFDTDASDGAPTTKQMVEDTDPHVDGMPSENIRLIVPSRMLKRMVDGFFIRPGGLPGASDIKTYDVGNLYVSTQGLAGNSAVVGELHVRYRCRVFIPILDAAIAAPTNNSVAVFRSNGVAAGATGTSYSVAFATTDVNGLGAVNTAGSIVLPVGNYLVDVSLNVNNSVNNAIEATGTFQKNGATYNGLIDSVYGASNSTAVGANVNFTTYVSSNGTDSFSLLLNVTWAGAGTTTGTIRFVAI